jgi:hypothetical protein
MRKVILNISKLGLIAGNSIDIKLVNSVGTPMMTRMGYSFNASFTLNAPLFEVDLLENEAIDSISMYKITLPSAISFTFEVPLSYDYDLPHDLISLLNIGCFYEIINQDTKTLDSDFIKKLNLYFTGKNPHFTAVQKDIVNLYEYYANEILSVPYTIDVMRMMDEHLSTLIGESNA